MRWLLSLRRRWAIEELYRLYVVWKWHKFPYEPLFPKEGRRRAGQ